MQNILKSLPFTFFSRTFYRELLLQWKGIAPGFILILILVDIVFALVTLYAPVQKFISTIPEVAASLPVVTVKNHTLSIDQPVPYTVIWPDFTTKKPAETDAGETDTSPMPKLVIDTNYTGGDLKDLTAKMDNEKIVVLITANRLITMKGKSHELRIQSFDNMPSDAVITHELWNKYAHVLVDWLTGAMIVCLIFGSAIVNVIKVLLGAVIAMLVNFFTKNMPDASTALRLSAATAIPPCILFLLLPRNGFIKFCVWVGYIIFGATSAPKTEVPVVVQK